jgi:hypothetical protein
MRRRPLTHPERGNGTTADPTHQPSRSASACRLDLRSVCNRRGGTVHAQRHTYSPPGVRLSVAVERASIVIFITAQSNCWACPRSAPHVQPAFSVTVWIVVHCPTAMQASVELPRCPRSLGAQNSAPERRRRASRVPHSSACTRHTADSQPKRMAGLARVAAGRSGFGGFRSLEVGAADQGNMLSYVQRPRRSQGRSDQRASRGLTDRVAENKETS